MASSARRILVFGGSFDPPHRGHLALLKAAAGKIQPDKIIIVPGFQTPFKGPAQAKAQDRLAMIKLGLISALPQRFKKICALELSELRARRKVYTVKTLEKLRRSHPEAELHFLTGGDAAKSFLLWKNPKRLKQLACFWTARRIAKISSTEIRRDFSLGRSPVGIPAAVSVFIHKRGLYQTGLLKRLKKSLKPGRFHHTLCVARLSGELAERWGLNPEKARLAGLLHDIGRGLKTKDMPAYARKRRLSAPKRSMIERLAPNLLHAYISADMARRDFGISDPEILSAVRKHTLGAPTMSVLDRLLYIADACSEDRPHRGAVQGRKIALRDLNRAFKFCVDQKLRHAKSKASWLHPATLELWNSLKNR